MTGRSGNRITRRALLQGAAGMAACSVLATRVQAAQPSTIAPQNGQIRLGLIGCGSMGMVLLAEFLAQPDVRLTAVCDVCQPHLQRALAASGGKAFGCTDFRRLLDRADVDAVVIATPSHWHAIMAALACQAGKDVYLEPPAGLSAHETRVVKVLAERHKRVVQVGFQERSGAHIQEALRVVRSGALGRISSVHAWHCSSIASAGFGRTPAEPAPKGLDWNLWQGPAPEHPFSVNRIGAAWRWMHDYSAGHLSGWAGHLIDMARKGMGADVPLAVVASGGRRALPDDTDLPDTVNALVDYPGFTLDCEFTLCSSQGRDGQPYGVRFMGTDGSLLLHRKGFELTAATDGVQDRAVGASPLLRPHVRNFLDCVKSRALPASPISDAWRTDLACQLAAVSLATGRRIRWDANTGTVAGDPAAVRLLARPARSPWRLPAV